VSLSNIARHGRDAQRLINNVDAAHVRAAADALAANTGAARRAASATWMPVIDFKKRARIDVCGNPVELAVNFFLLNISPNYN